MTTSTPCLLAAPQTYALAGCWIDVEGEPGLPMIDYYPVLAYNRNGQALIWSPALERLEPVDEYISHHEGERLLEVLVCEGRNELRERIDLHAATMKAARGAAMRAKGHPDRHLKSLKS